MGVELRYGGRSHHHHQQPQQQPLLVRSSSAVSATTAAVRAGVPSTLLIPRSEASMEPALPETPTWDMYSPIPTSTSSNARTLGLSSSNTRTRTLTDTNTKTQPPPPTDEEIERALYSRWSASTLASQLEHERVMTVKRETERVKNNKESMRGSSIFKSYFDFGSKSKKGRRSLRFSSLSSLSSSSSSAAAAVKTARNRNSTSTGGKSGNISIEMSPISPFFPFPPSPRSPVSYILPPTPPPSKKMFSVRSRAGRSSNESEKMVSGGVRRSASRSSISTNASGSVNSECGSYERQTRKQIPVEMFIKC